jgi:hypothetical protein
MSEKNPANAPARRVTEKNRVPMSLPLPKLAVPEIEGFHCHWFVGTPARIAQAQRAGYEYVDAEEVELNGFGVADDAGDGLSSDLGSRVSVVAGGEVVEGGGEQRLYLMKLRQEWWEQDQKVLADRSEKIASQLRGGKPAGESAEQSSQYVPDHARRPMANLFTPKHRRS